MTDVLLENVAPNSREKFTQLSMSEMLLYFVIWFATVGYATFEVYKAGEEYFNQYFLDMYNDFQTGWTWVGRKQDVADLEWTHGLKNLNVLLPYFFVHFMISEFLKNSSVPRLLPLWHLMTGSFFTISYLGFQTLGLFLVQPILYYFVVQLKKKSILWGFTLLLLITIHYLFDWTASAANTNEYINYECKMQLTTVSLAWINLRCLNYFLDALEDEAMKTISLKNYIKITSYCLYLPLLYFGPLVLYSDFRSSKWNEKGIKRTPFTDRLETLLSNLLRFGFWLFLAQYALHFFYVSAIPFQTDLVKDMNHFAFYGLGYLMGQFFHMKYVIFYGLSTSLTRFELEIPVPRTPKCIGRIHLYSDMWKHFDRGLYLFLVKYIFKPAASKSGRLIGSLLCFVFVYIWHGIQPYLLIWSTLNYVGIAVESLGVEISDSCFFQMNIRPHLSNRMYRRLKCVSASPLFAMSAVSFFYFCGGKDIGDIYTHRLLQGPFKVKFAIFFILYCGSQVSMQIKHIEEELQVKKSKKQHSHHHIHVSKTKCVNKKPERSASMSKPLPKQTQKSFIFSDKLIKFKSTSQLDQKMFSSKRQHQQRQMYLDSLREKSPRHECVPRIIVEKEFIAKTMPVEHQNLITKSMSEAPPKGIIYNEKRVRDNSPQRECKSDNDTSEEDEKKNIGNSGEISKPQYEDLYVREKPTKRDSTSKEVKVEKSIKDLSPKRLYELYKNTKDKKRKIHPAPTNNEK